MKRVAVTVSMLGAVALVGVVLIRGGDDGPATRAVGLAPVGDAVVAPLPAQTPSPEEAAAAAVAMTGDVVTAGLISRRELIESFTTPEFGSEFADVTSEQVTEMELSMTETGRSPAGLLVEEFPLLARTASREGTTATVEVWSVIVVTSADEPVARQAWRTVTLDLELFERRWLVDGWESVEGPAPAAAAEGAIASGADIAGVLAWDEAG